MVVLVSTDHTTLYTVMLISANAVTDAWDVIKVDYVCRGVCWMFLPRDAL